jgi:hypothetical protein
MLTVRRKKLSGAIIVLDESSDNRRRRADLSVYSQNVMRGTRTAYVRESLSGSKNATAVQPPSMSARTLAEAVDVASTGHPCSSRRDIEDRCVVHICSAMRRYTKGT